MRTPWQGWTALLQQVNVFNDWVPRASGVEPSLPTWCLSFVWAAVRTVRPYSCIRRAFQYSLSRGFYLSRQCSFWLCPHLPDQLFASFFFSRVSSTLVSSGSVFEDACSRYLDKCRGADNHRIKFSGTHLVFFNCSADIFQITAQVRVIQTRAVIYIHGVIRCRAKRFPIFISGQHFKAFPDHLME